MKTVTKKKLTERKSFRRRGLESQLELQIFEDEQHNAIRTHLNNGEVWFVAKDLCDALDLSNSRQALSRLESDEKDSVISNDVISRRRRFTTVNESGLFNLVLQSRKPEARRFEKWVTGEVLPQLRQTGNYSIAGAGIPNFIRRFNSNWDRVDSGYFSIINELCIRIYGRLEQVGYNMPNRGVKGKEIRPDVSVGKMFSNYLKKERAEHLRDRKTYMHCLPDGLEVEAYQYPIDLLPIFITFVEDVWIKERAI
ncbi:MAG: BRO family protein, partial [Opitutales bacterium]|nr:BRO family protein [Opitutales bacterium]